MHDVVDLRSDTLTKPSPAMRKAMAEAEVGDDVYAEDPTVNALQEAFAARVGKPAALYVPSGTMGNQIALRLHTRPGDTALAGARQHLVRYEAGAAARNASIQLEQLDDADGSFDAELVTAAVQRSGYHVPRPTLVCVEDTHLPSGGVPWPIERLRAVGAAAAGAGLPVHLDGARLFHGEAATGVPTADRGACVTSLTSCLSKGLGAPVGSVLAGPVDFIAAARTERQRLGGAMRQVGILAAAGLYALTNNVERLADDHARARALAEACAERWPGSVDPSTVQTNIVLFDVDDPAAVLGHLEAEGVKASAFAPGQIRFVTHLDVDDDDLERAVKAIRNAP